MADVNRLAIIVAGDVTIDWYAYEVPPVTSDAENIYNWKLQPGTNMIAAPGGAMLLAQLIQQATSQRVSSHRIKKIRNIHPNKIVHSIAELARYPYSAKEDRKVFRIKNYRGFSGPAPGSTPNLILVSNDQDNPALLVIDDAGNGFRYMPDFWPQSLKKATAANVILKMSRPLAKGPLWDRLQELYEDRLIVIIGANDLRSDGMNMSRRLSWERTATDFLWQLTTDPKFSSLANCSNVIIRFGLDGAIYYRRQKGRTRAVLYFDPASVEDEFFSEKDGTMAGFTSAFVAAIARDVLQSEAKELGSGVKEGLLSARRLMLRGFGSGEDPNLKFSADVFHPDKSDVQIAEVPIPLPSSPVVADPDFWSILRTLNPARLEEIARDIVMNGEDAALTNVPIATFGKLKTVDRSEIESFRSIKNLLQEYIRDTSGRPPLSIAVFGRPGSGKSFGVTQVAESINKDLMKKIEFNLSQFTSSDDLINAFHMVRDISLKGNLPLVFFDEFDSNFNGKLGWLKYFLAPMQDGVFKEGDAMHPIGKAVFVFAGGTKPSYKEFVSQEGLADAKGTDFISRLRGYVDILGPDPDPDPARKDVFAIIRRAMVLRNLSKKLFDAKKRPRIDEGVLRAFLKIPSYKHGTRSIQAILEMSMLQERGRLEPSALPPVEQLKLHVDAAAFMRLVLRDVIFAGYVEKIAMAVQEKYREQNRGIKPAGHPAMEPWEKLSEGYRNSNRGVAKDIYAKLQRIHCDFGPLFVGTTPPGFAFTPEEIDLLAEMEHERWMREKIEAGFTLGSDDPERKTNPDLKPWSELSETAKNKDHQSVLNLPKILEDAGFYIYRLE
ncbi:AAA family ATPase [bacterium]|nr:AAA family ATPase [bacterium]MCI0601535.1 AAA family ATPase [bacterium]